MCGGGALITPTVYCYFGFFVLYGTFTLIGFEWALKLRWPPLDQYESLCAYHVYHVYIKSPSIMLTVPDYSTTLPVYLPA